MSLACIIEQDVQTIRQIEKALSEIDSRMQVLVFNDLEGFYQWFSELIKKNDPQTKKEDLKLLMGDIKFLGPNYFSLIEKVRKLMVRRGLLSKEDDLAILLTAFDSPNMDFKQIESRIITNVLFKPFDLPILKQHLLIALANQKVISESAVFNQSLHTQAEMLKEVQLEAFSELGFITRSNRHLEIDDISKYYSSHFAVDGKSSLLARCISCRPHPSVPNEFQAEFRFTGLSNSQVKQLRLSFFSMGQEKSPNPSLSKKVIPKAEKKDLGREKTINVMVFMKDTNDVSAELKNTLEQNLTNIHVLFNRNMVTFTEALAKNDLSVLGPYPISVVMINYEQTSGAQSIEAWSRIQEQIEQVNTSLKSPHPKPRFFLTSSFEIPDEKLKAWAGLIEDVIYLPIDRTYITKRLVTLFSGLEPRQNSLEISTIATSEIIRVANPIELTSISEACLTMKYYRPISFHSFRRFCLPSLNGTETLELLASCYFYEKKDNEYINHFVFFGITDKYLKYIRKWILEKYIAGKESAA